MENTEASLSPAHQRAVNALKQSSEDEINTLIYALSCLVENPGYFQSPPTSAAIERIYDRLTGESQ
jgi:hypothetical protein